LGVGVAVLGELWEVGLVEADPRGFEGVVPVLFLLEFFWWEGVLVDRGLV
jgi:hypothetical protein